MNLIKKLGIGVMGLASMMALFSCMDEGDDSSYYWYSTYQAFENTTDNRPYYTFYVDLSHSSDNVIEAKKEDFKVTDKNGSYTPVGFITNYSYSSIEVGGKKVSQYNVTLVDNFTFKKGEDGVWNNVILAFTDNFDKESTKVTYKGTEMTIKPGYTF